MTEQIVERNEFISLENIYGIHLEVSRECFKKRRKFIRATKGAIKVLPPNILNYLQKHNFTIKFVSKKYLNLGLYQDLFNKTSEELKIDGLNTENNDLKNYKKNGRAGLYIWGTKNIYVSFVSIETTLLILHEISHFLDYNGAFDLSYDDLIKIKGDDHINQTFRRCNDGKFPSMYVAEKYFIREAYYRASYSEFFAETLARYLLTKPSSNFLNRILFPFSKKKYIKTYEYMEDFVKNF